MHIRHRFLVFIMSAMLSACSQKIVPASDVVILEDTGYSAKSQDGGSDYDESFDLVVATMTRNLKSKLLIKRGSGNTFTGIMKIDGDDREVFGWYIEKRSEGGGRVYNTNGIVFYVKINGGFGHQQLYKATFNYDKTLLSGDYFYWGNELIFTGERSK